MDEKETTQEKFLDSYSEDPVKPVEEGDKPDERPILERVSEERKRTEKVLEDMRAERAKLEELHTNIRLGGKSGLAPVEEVKEETAKDYAERTMKNE